MDYSRERELNDLKKQQEKIALRMKELASDEASDMVGDTKESLQKHVDVAMDKLRQFNAALSDTTAQAREQAGGYARKADDYAKENPWNLVAGAVALGALVGMLVSRDRR